MEQERRKAPRFLIEQMIQLGEGWEEYFWARGIDFSRLGLRCISSKILEPLDRIFGMLALELDGKTYNVRFEGYVARSKPIKDGCELGVSFTDFDSEDSAILDRFFSASETAE